MMLEHVINTEKIKRHTQYWIGNLKGQDHFRDLGICLEAPLQWLFHVRCNGAGASNQLKKGSHDKTFVNMVVNLLDSIEQEMSLPNETCELFKEDFVQCH